MRRYLFRKWSRVLAQAADYPAGVVVTKSVE